MPSHSIDGDRSEMTVPSSVSASDPVDTVRVMVFERRCAACRTPGPSPCVACIDLLRPEGEVEVAGLDRCLAVVSYDDISRLLVADLKYRGVRSAVAWMVAAMTARVTAAGERFDLVTWVPAAPANRRRRGFDQAEVLGRSLARALEVPAVAVARRRRGAAQTGMNRAQRLGGPDIVARPVRSVRLTPGGAALIVDDVMTTGASLGAVARVLAPDVRRVGVVFAHRR